jgi:hypothetical protein
MSPTRALRRLLASLALLFAAWLALSPGLASARTLHTVVQDDTLSLFSPASLSRSMATLRWLGVDYVRISAEWKLEAADPDSSRTPPGFAPGDPAASDPSSYDSPGMLALDRAVRVATRAGLQVMVDPAFSAPLWATHNRPASTNTGDPWFNRDIDIRQLVDWEVMLSRRYSGSYALPGASAPLPRAAAFTLWNEPNGSGFLQPQWSHGVAASADWYRQLVDSAYPAIKRAAPSATVLIGNTSDAGGDAETGTGGVPPLDFIRRLACVDAQLRPVDSGACTHFRTVPGDGFAHHPYERSAPPWVPSAPVAAGWVQMGDLGALQSLLNTLVAMHRLAPGAGNLWLTEQGYESNAQLTERPWTEAQQAQLNADSEYLTWRDPRAVSFSQFLLRDTLTRQTLALRAQTRNPRGQVRGTWTTGLERQNGAAKPALAMFRSPIVARVVSTARRACTLPAPSTRGSVATVQQLEVWGRARPARSAVPIRVELKGKDANSFARVKTTTSDANGIFDVRLWAPSGAAVRFQWRQGGSWQTSPSATSKL